MQLPAEKACIASQPAGDLGEVDLKPCACSKGAAERMAAGRPQDFCLGQSRLDQPLCRCFIDVVPANLTHTRVLRQPAGQNAVLPACRKRRISLRCGDQTLPSLATR